MFDDLKMDWDENPGELEGSTWEEVIAEQEAQAAEPPEGQGPPEEKAPEGQEGMGEPQGQAPPAEQGPPVAPEIQEPAPAPEVPQAPVVPPELSAQLEASRQERALMAAALAQLGYKGTPQDISDQVEASTREMTVEELRRQRQQAEEQRAQSLEQDPRYQQVQQELETLRQREMQRQFADDLAAIKGAYPQEAAPTVESLGLDFIRLRANGVDPVVAYRALHPEPVTPPTATPPPDPGKVEATRAAQAGFYTKEEVAAMSQEQVLRDLDKVNQSMQFWK